jgi:hypothetical protein
LKIAISWTVNEAFLASAARDPALHGVSTENLFLECLPVPKGIAAAARRRGYEVRALIGNGILENSASSHLLASWIRHIRRTWPLPRIDAALWGSWRDRWLLQWKPDVYVYCGAVPSSQTAARLKERGTLLVQYTGVYPDALPPNDPVRRGLAAADVAICNSEEIARQAARLGCRQVRFIWSAYEDSHFHDIDALPWTQRPFEVGFVGELGSLHSARRAFLTELFERCRDLKMSLHTNSKDLPVALRSTARPAGGPRDMARLLSLSRISLNVQADGNEHETRGTNFRTFEIPAARCVQVMPSQKGIEDIFVPDQDIVCVASAAEAEYRIRALLADPQHAEAMVRRAYVKVIGNHTWTRRGDEILDYCDKEARRAASPR